jgi:copper(I)-binding protein
MKPKFLAFFVMAFFMPQAFAKSFGNIEITNYFAALRGQNLNNLEMYMVIDNAGDADQLLSASSPDCTRVKIQKRNPSENALQVQDLSMLDIPMDKPIELSQAGAYLLCEGLSHPAEEGKSIDLFLVFANGGGLEIFLPVKKVVSKVEESQNSSQQKRGKRQRSSSPTPE